MSNSWPLARAVPHYPLVETTVLSHPKSYLDTHTYRGANSMLHIWRRLFDPGATRRRRPTVPVLEPLEDRTLLSTSSLPIVDNAPIGALLPAVHTAKDAVVMIPGNLDGNYGAQTTFAFGGKPQTLAVA